MEVYIDDIIVKMKEVFNLIKDLQIYSLRFYNMRLNLQKCIFGVISRKFLGYLVTQHGIKANQVKVKSILHMQPPRSVKKVQKLTG